VAKTSSVIPKQSNFKDYATGLIAIKEVIRPVPKPRNSKVASKILICEGNSFCGQWYKI